MPASQVDGWLSFFSEEPNFMTRMEIQIAQLTAAVYRSQGHKAHPKDFYAHYENIRPETAMEMKDKLTAAFSMFMS